MRHPGVGNFSSPARVPGIVPADEGEKGLAAGFLLGNQGMGSKRWQSRLPNRGAFRGKRCSRRLGPDAERTSDTGELVSAEVREWAKQTEGRIRELTPA
jgi:hypothetical protein